MFFFRKSCRLWGKKQSKFGHAIDYNMAHTNYMPDTKSYKHTLTICKVDLFSTASMVARTRLNVTLYVHCLSCSQFIRVLLCCYKPDDRVYLARKPAAVYPGVRYPGCPSLLPWWSVQSASLLLKVAYLIVLDCVIEEKIPSPYVTYESAVLWRIWVG